MVRLRILDLLEEQEHTKYWLYKQMDMMSYRIFKKIVDNETSSIRFETLDKLSRILNFLSVNYLSKWRKTTIDKCAFRFA